MKFHIETVPGYGMQQGIMPRFYLQMMNLCNFQHAEPFISEIPEKFLTKIIPEIANFYDVHKTLQISIQEFSKGVQDGSLFKIKEDGSTTFLRKKEFEIINLVKDFFIRGKILQVRFFKGDIIADDNFKISEFFFCDDKKFEAKFLQNGIQKYKPILCVLKDARAKFLNEFTKIRGDIEHEDFELNRFQVVVKNNKVNLIEPNFQEEILSKKIEYYYRSILDLIEKITAYFAGINCEEKNHFQKLYIAKPDYSNFIYTYCYRIMDIPFVYETIRCGYN